jgi:hypothetical protein
VDADDDAPAVDRAALWDLPAGVPCGLVDLPAEPDDAAAAALAAALTLGGENRLAVRSGGTWVRRLVPATAPEPDPKTAAALRSGTALVAGSGPLAREFAAALAAQGAGRVLLAVPAGATGDAPPAGNPDAPHAAAQDAPASTATPAADAAPTPQGTRSPGHGPGAGGSRVATVVYAEGDGEALASALAGLPADLPLAAVAVVAEGGAAAPEAAVRTAQWLDRLTRAYDPVAFVLLSDALLPVLGLDGAVTGEPHPHAVHAPFEALALARRTAGLPAVAVALGPWRPSGGDDGDGAVRAVRAGMLTHVLTAPAPSMAVADIAWEARASAPVPPLLAEVPRPPAGAPDGAGGLRDRLAAASGDGRLDLLVELVRTHAAGVLGHGSADAVPADASLLDLGFSSFTALELRGLLSRDTGLDVSAMAVFDHPTALGLARHLHDALTAPEPSAAGSATG